jgi:hypothetical protein
MPSLRRSDLLLNWFYGIIFDDINHFWAYSYMFKLTVGIFVAFYRLIRFLWPSFDDELPFYNDFCKDFLDDDIIAFLSRFF